MAEEQSKKTSKAWVVQLFYFSHLTSEKIKKCVSLFHKLLFFWEFHTHQFLEFRQHGLNNKKICEQRVCGLNFFSAFEDQKKDEQTALADRKTTVSQSSTLYKHAEQKSISDRRTLRWIRYNSRGLHTVRFQSCQPRTRIWGYHRRRRNLFCSNLQRSGESVHMIFISVAERTAVSLKDKTTRSDKLHEFAGVSKK